MNGNGVSSPPEELVVTQVGSNLRALLRFSNGSVYDVSLKKLLDSSHQEETRAVFDQRSFGEDEAELGEGQAGNDDGDVDLSDPALRLRKTGLAIWKQLKSARYSDSEWDRIEQNLNRIARVTIEGDTRFHNFPWELMDDPEFGNVRDAAFVRRLKGSRRLYISPDRDEVLKILVVTARPFGSRDVATRTVVQPMLDAGLWVGTRTPTIDVLRGGTWNEFVGRLAAAAASQSEYHIVHFDMHGEVGTQEALTQLQDKVRFEGTQFSFDRKSAAITGEQQAFLLFEADGADDRLGSRIDPRSAFDVADVLVKSDVQLVVLNACKSADSSQATSGANLALHLAARGVPAAIGMRHSVSVKAASTFMGELYEALAKPDADEANPVTVAVQKARRKMTAEFRVGGLDLDESCLPALYLRGTPLLRVRQPDEDQSADIVNKRFRELDLRQRIARLAPVGVFGRDREEIVIRDLLFGTASHRAPSGRQKQFARAVCLSGLSGVGKTVLLLDLARHWDRINYVDKSVWFDVGEALSQELAAERNNGPLDPVYAADVVARSLVHACEKAGVIDEHFDSTMAEDYPSLWRQSLGRRLRGTPELLFIIDRADLLNKEARQQEQSEDVPLEHIPIEGLARALDVLVAEIEASRNWVIVATRSKVDWLATVPYERYLMLGLDDRATDQLAVEFHQTPSEVADLILAVDSLPGLMTFLFGILKTTKQSPFRLYQRFLGGDPALIEKPLAFVDPEILAREEEFRPFACFLRPSQAVIERGALVDFLVACDQSDEDSAGKLVDDLESAGLLQVVDLQPESDQGRDGLIECVIVHPLLPYSAAARIHRESDVADDEDRRRLDELDRQTNAALWALFESTGEFTARFPWGDEVLARFVGDIDLRESADDGDRFHLSELEA